MAVFFSLYARVKFAGCRLAGVSLAVVWSFAERLALVASRRDPCCGGIIGDWPTSSRCRCTDSYQTQYGHIVNRPPTPKHLRHPTVV